MGAETRHNQQESSTEEQARMRQELAALRLERDELAHQLHQREALLSAVGAGADVLKSTHDLNEVLAAILRQLEHVIAFDSASIFVTEGDTLRIIATRGLPPPEGGLSIRIAENPLARQVCSGSEPLIIDDVRAIPGFIPTAGSEIRSWIGVPLHVGERQVGVLTVDHQRRSAYSAADGLLIAGFAQQAALALHSAQLYAESQRRAQETGLLLELTRAVGSTLYLPEVLLRAAGAIAEATGADDVLLLLLDDGGTGLTPQAGTSAGQPLLRLLWPAATKLDQEPLLATVLREQQARILGLDDGDMPPAWQRSVQQAGLDSLLLIPLVFKERALGLVVAAISRSPHASTPSRLALAQGLATSAALAIEHARLFEQARHAAVLEERGRLARELHDSVTQALFSITLTAQAASGQISRNQERASEQLQRLQATAQQALGEMRELLLQLRPIPLREGGLSKALREHITRVTCLGGPDISLIVSGDERLVNGNERALYRIAQEALSNAMRHANASKIEVELAVMPELLRLEVRDNGCGFNPEARVEPGRQLGLRSMAERAAEMSGKLILQSRPETGTTVAVEVPLAPQKQPAVGASVEH